MWPQLGMVTLGRGSWDLTESGLASGRCWAPRRNRLSPDHVHMCLYDLIIEGPGDKREEEGKGQETEEEQGWKQLRRRVAL